MSTLDTFSLAGKTALLTGGAGLYGRQILRGLAEAGARTYIASRNLDALEAVAAEHRRLGHDVRALRLDQADETSIAAVRERIVAESGGLHVLVNNAVARPTKGLFDKAEKIDESMHVNGTGLILVTRGLADATAEGGSIINIGSIMGIGFPPWTGGAAQYITGYPGGKTAFVARAKELAARYGDRFTPPASLLK